MLAFKNAGLHDKSPWAYSAPPPCHNIFFWIILWICFIVSSDVTASFHTVVSTLAIFQVLICTASTLGDNLPASPPPPPHFFTASIVLCTPCLISHVTFHTVLSLQPTHWTVQASCITDKQTHYTSYAIAIVLRKGKMTSFLLHDIIINNTFPFRQPLLDSGDSHFHY